MLGRDTLKRHAALVDKMAEAQGVDLEEQMLRGALSISDLDDMVLRCTGCAQSCACESWLDTLSKTADEPPEYCRNSDVFATLKGAS